MEEYKSQLPQDEVIQFFSLISEELKLQLSPFFNFHATQCDKLREEIAKVREFLTNKDNADPEEIKKATSSLQQSSLKLFELAYKKMASERESSSSSSSSKTEDNTNSEQKKEDKN